MAQYLKEHGNKAIQEAIDNNNNISSLYNHEANRGTEENNSFPEILGNAGKSKEISRIFTSILQGESNRGNEEKRTIQDNWLETIETIAKEEGIWIDNLSSIASEEIGYGQENIVFLSKDGNDVIKFNTLKNIHDKNSIIKFRVLWI